MDKRHEPVVVAELEICHSRPIAPTRRVALGLRNLPIDPPPGPGGVLLAGILAHTAPGVDPELREDLMDVMERLHAGRKVVQPRVRHRFQNDRVGLTVSRQRLVSDRGVLGFRFDDENARPVQLALGALYAAASLPTAARDAVYAGFQAALLWSRPVDTSFIGYVLGGVDGEMLSEYEQLKAWHDPISWAMDVLEIAENGAEPPSKRVVQRRFRSLVRDAHPDHGGLNEAAAARIAELTEARRILLATA
ncbi:MAG: hypothetical protein OER95_03330 [Acidimicrobiia bacterium]|nr:hypothetical protein [Acidimicrobiia bacterium]